jgi:hypothetical protein
MDEDIRKTGTNYLEYSIRMANAHYSASELFGRRNRAFGIPVTVITSLVATSIFATLSRDDSGRWMTIGTGFLSILAAVLSSLQTFLRFSELSAAHKSAAVLYDKARSDLELFFLEFGAGGDRKVAIKRLEEIKKSMDATSGTSPTIPDSVYDATNKTRNRTAMLFV